MKKKISEAITLVDCWCHATDVIKQLQYYIETYGEDNVRIDYDFMPYEDERKHLIIIDRLETDDEYEKRVAHETYMRNKQEAEEKLLWEQLKAKYES